MIVLTATSAPSTQIGGIFGLYSEFMTQTSRCWFFDETSFSARINLLIDKSRMGPTRGWDDSGLLYCDYFLPHSDRVGFIYDLSVKAVKATQAAGFEFWFADYQTTVIVSPRLSQASFFNLAMNGLVPNPKDIELCCPVRPWESRREEYNWNLKRQKEPSPYPDFGDFSMLLETELNLLWETEQLYPVLTGAPLRMLLPEPWLLRFKPQLRSLLSLPENLALHYPALFATIIDQMIANNSSYLEACQSILNGWFIDRLSINETSKLNELD
jgi:hypothetical protein